MTDKSKALLTVREAADRLTVNIETLRRWIRKGAVKVVLVGPSRVVRITAEECARHVRDT